MPNLLTRTLTRAATAFAPPSEATRREALAERFLAHHLDPTESPNGRFWFQSMSFPDGTRVLGANPDAAREPKLWEACFGTGRHTLSGKTVLDVGANDGYFSLASLVCGADAVTAVNTPDLAHGTFPANLQYAARQWKLTPQIVAADFLQLPTNVRYDVILFFGVLNHLDNVTAGMRHLERLLAPNGRIYLETPISDMASDVPAMEVASDVYGRVPHLRAGMTSVGNSNYLIPNALAVRAVAAAHGLCAAPLPSPNPKRGLFVLTRIGDGKMPRQG